MNWTDFLVILIQVVIAIGVIGIIAFVVSAAVVGIKDQIKKDRTETKKHGHNRPWSN